MKDKKYTCFEDYPQDIQEEAQKILEEGNPLEYFKKVIRQVHIGDKTAIELLLLSIGSLFIKNANPVHQEIKGSLGTGKTSLLQKTLRIVPGRYLKVLNNVSPEYLYSIRYSFNSDYNIFLLDDINPTPATTAMLRTLTDNKMENRVFIESKGTELEIPGKNLFLCILTEEKNTHKGFEHNLLPSIASERLKDLLKDIEKNEITGFDENSTEMQYLYHVANAVFEKLIENPIKVINPILLDINKNSTMQQYKKPMDIQRFVNLSKARTLYYPTQREQINNIRLGEEEDVDIANNMLQERIIMRDYKLSTKQKKLLLLLDVYTEELYNTHKNMHEPHSHMIHPSIPTYKHLAWKLETSKNVLRKMVEGKGKEGLDNLKERGFIKLMKVDYKKRNSEVLLYLNPKAQLIQQALATPKYTNINREERLKNRFTEEQVIRNNPFSDKTLIEELLELFLKTENMAKYWQKENHITTFMKKESQSIASYKDLNIYLHKFKDSLKFYNDK